MDDSFAPRSCICLTFTSLDSAFANMPEGSNWLAFRLETFALIAGFR